MKEIKAYIKPNRLGMIRNAVRHVHNFPGMNVWPVEDCPAHSGEEIKHGVSEELTDFFPRVRIEIVAPDDKVDELVDLIRRHAYTGHPSDGLIWVTAIETAVEICPRN